jgi:hypothetical protein
MTARLPRCAYCGKPLAGAKSRIIERHPSQYGGPKFGWHTDASDRSRSCFMLDMQPLFCGPFRHIPRIVAAIECRGPGRVIYTRKRKP